MNPSRREFTKLAVTAAAVTTPLARLRSASADASPRAALRYKCLFNHELLIIVGKKDNSPTYIASFIEKLRDTDVDAVICCPTAWRTNLFPSRVDPIERNYKPGQESPKFPGFARIMEYIHGGGDPVGETLAACRAVGKAFFISYRMNDRHYLSDPDWPTHNAIWREHPEYRIGDAAAAAGKGSAAADLASSRLFNYMLPEVRDYYFSIIQELCTNYDVDGVELDFQRHPVFFRQEDLEEGRGVMTAFIRKLKDMIAGIGKGRGKSLPLSVRVPETVGKCFSVGLDIAAWDREGLVEMVNISSFYNHTIELGVEGFRAATHYARLYGEMNYVTYQGSRTKSKTARRYTTIEIYRASALNLFQRGVDGLSLFNYDYVPSSQRVPMAEGLKRITDLEFLRQSAKDYAIYAGFGTFPAREVKTVRLVIPDDTSKVEFTHAILRVETHPGSPAPVIDAELNGAALEPIEREDTELFPPVAENDGYPLRESLRFFAVPLHQIKPGANAFRLSNRERGQRKCEFVSLELGLYR